LLRRKKLPQPEDYKNGKASFSPGCRELDPALD